MGKLFQEEVLFNEDPTRNAILPIKYPVLWGMYKNLQASSWTREEISFKEDIKQIHNGEIDSKIMNVVDYVLGFFSGADKIINDNLAENFLSKIQILESKFFYGQQIQNENVHNETYSFIVDVYYSENVAHKNKILNAVNTMPCVTKLYDWTKRWIKRTPKMERDENPILKEYLECGADDEVIDDLAAIWCEAKRIIAMACVEGIMFSASFCFIFWLKELGILPGLTFSNELISVDEGQHRDFACAQYNMITHLPPSDQVADIVRESVDFMHEFVYEMLSAPLTNMNAPLMNQYVKFTADSLVCQANITKIYYVTNSFPFMEKISFNGQTNFFERRVGEYSLSGFENEEKEDTITLDDNY